MKRSGPNLPPSPKKIPKYIVSNVDWKYLDFGQNRRKTEEPKKELFWRPKLDLSGNLLTDDVDIDDDFDMKLGSSILFDRKEPSEDREYQNEVDSDPSDREISPNRSTTTDYQRVSTRNRIRIAINDLFNENPHPKPEVMVQLSQQYNTRYRAIFESMDKKRISKGVECEEGDNCKRIRHWIEQDNEPIVWPRWSDEGKEMLELQIEAQLRSRIRLDLGHLHVILDNTNISSLLPTFVRAEYTKWKSRLIAPDGSDCTVREWRTDASRLHDALSLEALRKLEEVYLAKKYGSMEKEWNAQELRDLSNELNGVSVGTIRIWLDKRNGAVANPTSTGSRIGDSSTSVPSRPVPPEKVKVLEEEFSKNTKLSKYALTELAERLELRERTVTNYFSKLKKVKRKHEAWEKARQEVLTLNAEQKQRLEEVAAEKRKTVEENMMLADDIGVSYPTLCSFVDWKKSLRSKRSRFEPATIS